MAEKIPSYTPSPEEIKKAEEMMTSEQGIQSEAREEGYRLAGKAELGQEAEKIVDAATEILGKEQEALFDKLSIYKSIKEVGGVFVKLGLGSQAGLMLLEIARITGAVEIDQSVMTALYASTASQTFFGASFLVIGEVMRQKIREQMKNS